ncbi:MULTISPECIES: hypothetical protein [Myroides]|uniref:Uncharacterized protein n=1 Tax=Myroides albus TaxID=2562892 RepID=A0A6I3LQ55_9FLAO|nr:MULTISPECIES: hypothetical protein [Myroides]MTG98085.1 hypothetical protein [Myroides albus]MVX36277.1 hypothetical protein [Myroides sp. LoEW2-1]UVD80734.1 hypothetical protein NWE55_05670 [Myroides albus]
MKNFLLIIITVVLFRPVVPLLDYAIDYEYISTVLCINKEKPELECNGKCYLMQEMAKVAEDQNNDMAKKLSNLSFSFIYYLSDVVEIEFHNFASTLKDKIESYTVFSLKTFVDFFFRPPLIN